jgi:hypothetical protein
MLNWWINGDIINVPLVHECRRYPIEIKETCKPQRKGSSFPIS